MSNERWIPLTDEDRRRAFESLPDMLDGFMKKWGWLHFAKAIEAICEQKNSSAPAEPGMVSVPVDALKWLFGLGDDFERPDNARGNYWWRSEFRKRAGISDETVNQWAIATAKEPS